MAANRNTHLVRRGPRVSTKKRPACRRGSGQISGHAAHFLIFLIDMSRLRNTWGGNFKASVLQSQMFAFRQSEVRLRLISSAFAPILPAVFRLQHREKTHEPDFWLGIRCGRSLLWNGVGTG